MCNGSASCGRWPNTAASTGRQQPSASPLGRFPARRRTRAQSRRPGRRAQYPRSHPDPGRPDHGRGCRIGGRGARPRPAAGRPTRQRPHPDHHRHLHQRRQTPPARRTRPPGHRPPRHRRPRQRSRARRQPAAGPSRRGGSRTRLPLRRPAARPARSGVDAAPRRPPARRPARRPPLAGRESLDIAELADEPWVLGCLKTEAYLRRYAERAGFDPEVRSTTTDYFFAGSLVAAGLGISLIPSIALTPRVAGVRTVPIVPPAPTRHIGVAAIPRRGLPQVATVVAALLQRAAARSSSG